MRQKKHHHYFQLENMGGDLPSCGLWQIRQFLIAHIAAPSHKTLLILSGKCFPHFRAVTFSSWNTSFRDDFKQHKIIDLYIYIYKIQFHYFHQRPGKVRPKPTMMLQSILLKLNIYIYYTATRLKKINSSVYNL